MRTLYRWNCSNKAYESEKNYYSYDKCLKEAREAFNEYNDMIHVYEMDKTINIWQLILVIDKE